MLQNKKFIALLLVLLISVAGYNINYFANKDGGAVIERDEITDIGMLMEENMEMEELENGLSLHRPRPPMESNPIQLASIETLKEDLPPFSPEGMERNPFLTEEEALDAQNKPSTNRATRKFSKVKHKKTANMQKVDEESDPPISSASIKMIYRIGEESYVWIRGRAWREGEVIGKARLLKINEDSILLEREGESKTLFMDRVSGSEAGIKGVQINYEE